MQFVVSAAGRDPGFTKLKLLLPADLIVAASDRHSRKSLNLVPRAVLGRVPGPVAQYRVRQAGAKRCDINLKVIFKN